MYSTSQADNRCAPPMKTGHTVCSYSFSVCNGGETHEQIVSMFIDTAQVTNCLAVRYTHVLFRSRKLSKPLLEMEASKHTDATGFDDTTTTFVSNTSAIRLQNLKQYVTVNKIKQLSGLEIERNVTYS